MEIADLEAPLMSIVEPQQTTAPMPLTAALAELDAAVRLGGDALPPKLRHYLERRSYQKALECIRAAG